MAELTFKSAGVSTREIDLSGPRRVGPVGIPAGVIGTALEGPAFVPINVASFDQFKEVFGATDGEKFGPIAVSEWLRNAQSLVYLRVLGAGNGKKRDTSTGNVTNAGFVVGDPQVQDNGIVGNNPFSNHHAKRSPAGSTYFLGTFMSESNGSTIFSSAGIQGASTIATKECIEFAGFSNDDHIGITVPIGAGGTGVEFLVKLNSADATGATPADTNQLGVGIGSPTTAAEVATQVAAFINEGTDGSRITPPTGGADYTNGVLGLVATVSSSTKLILSAVGIGKTGNTIAIRNVNGNVATATALEGGSGGAVPILRGILLAPSGVLLSLSSSAALGGAAGGVNSDKPADTATAAANDASLQPAKGTITGSVNLNSQEFVMLMNGYDGTQGKTHITASFDMTQPNYFPNVFNTDPAQIEKKGHCLYGSYDIYPDLAAVTGSGALKPGVYTPKQTSVMEDIAFLMTGSNRRVAGQLTITTPNTPVYESFEDRFTHAESPYIITQKFGADPYDAFKVHALSDGAGPSTKFKISIENISKATSDIDPYGTFDLLVRRFSDTDDERVVLESFRGLSLDPGSDRYVARAIGDQHVFFNFDNDAESQKITVDGSHPVRSRYIRVQMSNAMKAQEVPSTALPMGFRGPRHLNTSGSLMSSGSVKSTLAFAKATFLETDKLLSRVVEPPFPYRETVAQGTGIQKRDDSRLYWGMQSTRKTSATTPNKVGLFDNSLNTFVKHFPTHRKDTLNFSVGDNAGAADVAGTVVDSDRFNNNKFTMENVKVRLGSDSKADPEYWLSASYVRDGNISSVTDGDGITTRAFQVGDLDRVANKKFVKFTLPLQGGFDGLNIFDSDQSKMLNASAKREMDDATQGETAGNTVASFRKAIDIMSSKTDVDVQLLAIPGLRHASITDYAINATEQRFDAMYIMDVEERDQFNTVITSSVSIPHVSNTVTSFKNRSLDSSFAAAYFPDLVVTDPTTQALVQVPPSVSVLGAYSINDRIGHPWFAPAGFTRGALDSVEMASVRLNRTNLDDLYDADLNPITAFPGTGVTVWGQKTLMAASSALDRVNVRRLLIAVRRKVKNIANTLLFEPNREETLEKFSALVNPVLQQVQEQSGVDRFKVVIDTTTTTQADVENNTIRGKIFLQPTRSVEFIALDFVVTNAGSNI